EAVGENFIIVYRLSMLDLLPDGNEWPEIVAQARAVEAAGATIINTGIGWHEARIPTIATMVPRAAFTWVTRKLKGEVRLPLVTTNRINTPETAETVLARGDADIVSMARPLLADADFVRKAETGRADEINVCIACNQACLDHTFSRKLASCLVNPRACHETLLNYLPAEKVKNIAVVGAGPAGLAFATVAAGRGHHVTLFDSASEIGGQFNLAKRIPGKEEFYETLRYFSRQLEITGVDVRLGIRAGPRDLEPYEEVVLATGVTPRTPGIDGIEHKMVVSYLDVLTGTSVIGQRAALIGAGGIGFDVAEFLSHSPGSGRGPRPATPEEFSSEWGIDLAYTSRGGVKGVAAQPQRSIRELWMLQRKTTKMGQGLGKTTGWTHRLSLRNRGVNMLTGVSYKLIDDAGLHIEIEGQAQLLQVDNVVICAGQEPKKDLLEPLLRAGVSTHLIGGADLAVELDAKRAIKQGSELAAAI
ncbi:MAG TPA: FAD-dependent oxidoreductase, partial [Xanthomonadales bacterium]|nr:FAD-dependent oxidoreductase [Xanthomonadales bacterium]